MVTCAHSAVTGRFEPAVVHVTVTGAAEPLETETFRHPTGRESARDLCQRMGDRPAEQLPSGSYQIVFYALSAATGQFDNVRVIPVIVP